MDQIRIPLTSFIDFALTSGTPQITVVRRVKTMIEGGYEQSFDYYRRLRDAIIQMHKEDKPASDLDDVLSFVGNKAKFEYYQLCIGQYRKWIGRKRLVWCDPTKSDWVAGELAVNVNPDIGLLINDKAHMVKLYFKGEKLTARRVHTMLHLMTTALAESRPDAISAILDVRRGRFYTPGKPISDIDALLAGQAAAFTTMWSQMTI